MGQRRQYRGKRPSKDAGNRESGKRQRLEGPVPKKKYAIVLGYFGTEYHGMQKQICEPGQTSTLPTIEGVLEDALVKVGALTTEQVSDPERIQWSRLGRTDRGVHAACQVVSCKITLRDITPEEKTCLEAASQLKHKREGVILTDEQQEILFKARRVQRAREAEFCADLQKHLPPTIQVLDTFRVVNNFDARLKARQRQYEYYLPSFCLQRLEFDPTAEDRIHTFIENYAPEEHKAMFAKSKRLSVAQRSQIRDMCLDMGFNSGIVHSPEGSDGTGADLPESQEPTLADLVYRLRREEMVVRRSFALLSAEKRDEVWRKFALPGEERLFNCPYGPMGLLYVRPRQMTKEEKENFRLPDSDLDRVRQILAPYHGTHVWYNFTSRLKPDNPTARRHMIKIEVHRAVPSSPVGEILCIRLQGQSFLFNQIRKMMSLVIETCIGSAPHDTIPRLLKSVEIPRYHVHVAPGEGLLLERAEFDLAYIERVHRAGQERSGIVETHVPKNGLERLVMTHEAEALIPPYTADFTTFLSTGKYKKTEMTSAANLLLVEEDVPLERTVEVEDDFTSAEDPPVFYRVLRYKLDTLVPYVVGLLGQNIFERFTQDLLWHPFITENYPAPVGRFHDEIALKEDEDEDVADVNITREPHGETEMREEISEAAACEVRQDEAESREEIPPVKEETEEDLARLREEKEQEGVDQEMAP